MAFSRVYKRKPEIIVGSLKSFGTGKLELLKKFLHNFHRDQFNPLI